MPMEGAETTNCMPVTRSDSSHRRFPTVAFFVPPDQTVANLALTEYIVVSVPAGTEIYVILQKPTKDPTSSPRARVGSQAQNQLNFEELRHLMRLQHELNQPITVKPPE